MEKQEVYYDYSKARLKLGLGIVLLPIVILFVPSIFKIIGLIIAGSIIYFSRKAVSEDVQLIFDDESMYLGVDSKKTHKKDKIKSIKITTEKVDFRKVDYINVTRYIKGRGKIQTNVNSYPIEYLDITNIELQLLIDEFLGYD